ncbi:beta-N-acetylhexosaminidase [Amycolatopsis marina]|uniref:beta-N-acetylhexosaminidase n=1 Tax=Amycolatopsis marina TaxID=490629 RepID=A0A1I1BT17_9PSEU|nr:glycoside hydrolase family 3 protein [Amycolatopsis marina]SFB52962.1 beta-N-acetylhexosaminidase [Amycolatopsis marina]
MRSGSSVAALAIVALTAGGVAAPAIASPPDDMPVPACAGVARSTLAQMSLKHRIGQLVMSQPSSGGSMPGDGVRRQIEEWGFGSWIIQNRGGAADNVARYTNQMQSWAAESGTGVPLLIGADMENGAEQQVPDATPIAYPMGLGATRNVEDSATAGEITGAEAAAMGVNWNFMPVADVNTNPANPVIGVRSFGEDPDLVAEHVTAYAVAQQEENVLASAKHFPGHGDTATDSHLDLPTVTFDRQTLEQVHLKPFQHAIDAGLDSIMTSHVVVEAVDDELPATLSHDVLTGLLRQDMGFDGLVITDGMGMRAISERWGTGDAAVMAIEAGADVILAGDTAEVTAKAIYDSVISGRIPGSRIDESVLRILRTKCDYGLFTDRWADPRSADEVAGSARHMAEATRIGQRSITMVKNDDLLPLAGSDADVAVVGPEQAEELAANLAGRGLSVTATETPRRPGAEAIDDAADRARQSDVAIALTYTFSSMPPEQQELVDALIANGKPVVAVSLGIPYDLAGTEQAGAAIATYALNVNAVLPETVLTGLADVLVGDASPEGRLPVTIGGLYPYGTGLSY